MAARYWYCPDDNYHPMVFDNNGVKTQCYCISCDFYRNINQFKTFKEENNGNILPVTLPILAIWIDKFKNNRDFRKYKIEEIAKYLLINGNSV